MRHLKHKKNAPPPGLGLSLALAIKDCCRQLKLSVMDLATLIEAPWNQVQGALMEELNEPEVNALLILHFSKSVELLLRQKQKGGAT